MKWASLGVILFISANVYGQLPMALPKGQAPAPFSFTIIGTIRNNGTSLPLQYYVIERNGDYTVSNAEGTFKIIGTVRDTLAILYKSRIKIRIPLAGKPTYINQGEFNVQLAYNAQELLNGSSASSPSIKLSLPPGHGEHQAQATVKVSPDAAEAGDIPVKKSAKKNAGKADKAYAGQTKTQDVLAVKTKTKHINTFPFPPPKGYTDHVLDRNLFAKCQTLGDVNEIILRAIDHCQYDDKSYYPIPGGFALITKIEEMKSDGTSVSGDDRFGLNKDESMTLWDWISPRKGYFRFFAFLVTDQDFQATDEELTGEGANNLLESGYNVLPEEIAMKEYTTAYDCTVIVYEFEAPDVNSKLQSIIPARLTAVTHLNKSHISQFLTEEP